MARGDAVPDHPPQDKVLPSPQQRNQQSVLMSKIVPILMILGIALAGVWLANNVDAVANLVGKRAK